MQITIQSHDSEPEICSPEQKQKNKKQCKHKKVIGIITAVVVLLLLIAVIICLIDGDVFENLRLRWYGLQASKPTPEHAIRKIMNYLEETVKEDRSYTFVDLGCGTGSVVSGAALYERKDGSKLFSRYVGVELDEAAVAEAQVKFKSNEVQNAKVVQGDMFQFIQNAYGQQGTPDGTRPEHIEAKTLRKSKDPVVVYMYEPLWTAEKSDQELDESYNGLLKNMKNAPRDSLVVYVPAYNFRQVNGDWFKSNGFNLIKEGSVHQNGRAFPANALEIWKQ